MEVRTPEHLLTSERDSKDEGVSKHHRHRDEDGATEKHRTSEGKSSRHKHKHHKHKHRKKHRKGHAEASADEIGSDRGDCGSVDPTQRDSNSLTGDMELPDVHIRKDDSVVMEEERAGMAREGDMLDEAQRLEHLEVRLPGIISRHAMDDEMEEGEILDEEDTNHKVASSDMESGEIEGINDSRLREGHSAEILNPKSGKSSSNHKALDEEPGKAVRSVAPALESIFGIAEAYDSEQISDDTLENVKRKPKPNRDSQSQVETSISPSKFGNFHSLHLHGSDSADYANAKAQRRKRSRSPESIKDEPSSRRLQSPFQESEIEGLQVYYKGDSYHNRSSPGKIHTTSGRSLSRESDRKDHNRVKSFEVSPRLVESAEADDSRRSRSRERAIYSRHQGESYERTDLAESRELGQKHGYKSGSIAERRRSTSREAKDMRGRRSRSRETGRDHVDRYERSDQGRRSRSREAARDSRYSKDSTRRESDRVRRSRSRESEHYSRHMKDSSRRSEHGRRSLSRDIAHDSRYAKNDLERSDRGRRSRSREVLRGSRHTVDDSSKQSRGRDIAYDLQDNRDRRTRYDWRRSRSRDGGRQDYSERRRRSLSRSGRDSLDRRRRSRSRGGYGEHADRRRRSRSIENSRDQRMTDQSFGSGRHAQGEGRADRERSEYQNLRDLDITKREEDNQEDYQDSATLQSEEEDIEKEVEKIRMRRRAILDKHKKQEQSERVRNLDLNMSFDANLGASDSTGDAKISLDENASVVSGYAFNLGKGSLQNGSLDRPSGTRGLGEGTPKSEEKSNDIFNDFIFGESPAGGRKLVKGDGLALETSGLNDNWDDAEGYYCHRIGEVLDGRYEVAASHGRGVFSTVVRARDLRSNRKDVEEVAIKIIRNNDVMLKSGQQELSILKKLDGADPENRRHCVRFLSSFDYRKHLCLVFESMHMNLREVLKKFGRNIGLNLGAVRAYAKQLFIALKHLRNCGVLHCDIKPDNMLVNEAKNVLKLCDFGSAMFAGENEITPYLVSRFYRAPEIILGLPYDHPLDMWSVGCCLYEFFTGKVLFPGPTNNDMLRLHMELKGPFPKKMLKKAGFVSKHFDQDYNFCAVEEDPVTKASIKRVLVNVKPKDITSLVTGQGTSDENVKMLANFKDLLDKIFMLDPEKRLTVSQALSHPFITGK